MGFLWDFLSVSSNKKIEYFTRNYQLKISYRAKQRASEIISKIINHVLQKSF